MYLYLMLDYLMVALVDYLNLNHLNNIINLINHLFIKMNKSRIKKNLPKRSNKSCVSEVAVGIAEEF